MSLPFFSVSENRARLREEALSWDGTPFHERGATKGPHGGVNCVSLLHAIATNLGAIDPEKVKLPDIPMNWHEHNSRSLLLEFFRNTALRTNIRAVDKDEDLMAGDYILLQIKHTEHHLCQMINESHLIHCHRKKGVCFPAYITLSRFHTSTYRLYQ